MTKDKANIVNMNPNAAAEAVRQEAVPPLTEALVAVAHEKAHRLHALAKQKLVLPGAEQERDALAQDLAGFLLTYSLPLLEGWMVVQREYHVLLSALSPAVSRVLGQLQRAQAARAAKAEKPAKE